MKRILRWSLGLVLIAGFTGVGRSTAAGSPASSTKRYLQITVRVDNRVHMPPGELAGAEQVATQILRQAGVQALWLDCTITVATDQWQPVCDRPLGPTDFLFSFVEQVQSLSPRVRENTLGFAMVPDAGGQGDRAYISNRHARATARHCERSPEMILGLAAAHEIGHLLMGSGEHSRSGLMRAGWDAEDLERAARGDLQFSDDQVKRVHAGVLARMEQLNAAR
jgi:hypothetical protein